MAQRTENGRGSLKKGRAIPKKSRSSTGRSSSARSGDEVLEKSPEIAGASGSSGVMESADTHSDAGRVTEGTVCDGGVKPERACSACSEAGNSGSDHLSGHPGADCVPLVPFREALIRWFQKNQRDLPWRRRRDAYAVWLSEVMLQQTQVVTVIPYFHRFMERFPSVSDLAAAPLDDVLSLWSGLGYYARARNLHKAARLIADGGFPENAADLRKLPGLGAYTSAAIASFAFGEAVPVLDGNVARVLCRAAALELPDDQNLPELKALSEKFLDRQRPGPFNEAMMELGALVCTPSSPRCSACPVASFCRAFERGDQNRLPLPRVRLEKKPLRLVCAAIRDDAARVWMIRREAKGLFGGLWELPSAEIPPEADAREVLRKMGFYVQAETPLGRVRCTLTHRLLTIELWPASFACGIQPSEGTGRFVSPDDWSDLGLSTAMRKALVLLEKSR